MFLTLWVLACTPSDTEIVQLYPSLVVSPGEVDFGEVVVDYPATATVEIINGGRVELDIDSLGLSDDHDGVFSIQGLEPQEEGDTGAPETYALEFPLTLESDERLVLQVDFLPATYLDYATTLQMDHNDPDQQDFALPITGVGSDGPTPDIELDVQTLDFPSVAPGNTSVQWVTISNVGDGDLRITDSSQTGSGNFVIAQKPEDGDVIAAGSSTTAIVAYTPTDAAGDNGLWTLESDDPDEPTVQVQLLGNGGGDYEYPVAQIACPSDIAPPESRTLNGGGSYDPNGLELVEYIWSLARVPDGASAELQESSGETAEVYFDIAGSYEVTLQVVNELGVTSAPAECDMDAIPEDAIHVELLWNTSHADLDLHMANAEDIEFFDSPDDVSYCNRSPNWGALTSGDDDPRLDLDDRSGFGPENINILSPADGRYPVRVHNFDANGDGASSATLRFYLNGVLSAELTESIADDEVWEAGIIKWEEGAGLVIEDGTLIEEAPARNCF